MYSHRHLYQGVIVDFRVLELLSDFMTCLFNPSEGTGYHHAIFFGVEDRGNCHIISDMWRKGVLHDWTQYV